jgi:hypothetical protein
MRPPGPPSAGLDALQAQLDAEVAARKRAEARADLAESRAKELEDRLAILQKSGGSTAAADPKQEQKLQAALAELAQTKKALEEAQAKLASAQKGSPQANASSGSGVAMANVAQAESRQMQAENQVVKSQVELTKAQLGASSRSAFIAEDNSAQLEEARTQADALEAKASRVKSSDSLVASGGMSESTADAIVAAAEARKKALELERQGFAKEIALLESSFEEMHKRDLAEISALKAKLAGNEDSSGDKAKIAELTARLQSVTEQLATSKEQVQLQRQQLFTELYHAREIHADKIVHKAATSADLAKKIAEIQEAVDTADRAGTPENKAKRDALIAALLSPHSAKAADDEADREVTVAVVNVDKILVELDLSSKNTAIDRSTENTPEGAGAASPHLRRRARSDDLLEIKNTVPEAEDFGPSATPTPRP